MLRSVLLALALAIGPADGLAETAPAPAPAPALRGPVQPAADPKPLGPLPSPRAAPNDLVTGLMASPTPGVASGLQSDGGECRRSCAKDLYMCGAGRDATDCNPAWTRCVAACSQVGTASP